MGKVLFDLVSSQPIVSKFHGAGNYGLSVFKEFLTQFGLDSVAVTYRSDRYLTENILTMILENKLVSHDLVSENLDEVCTIYDTYFTPLPIKSNLPLSASIRIKTVCHDVRSLTTSWDLHYFRFIRNWKELCFYLDSLLLDGSLSQRLSKKNLLLYMNRKNVDFCVVSYYTLYSLKTQLLDFSNREIPVFYSPSILHQYQSPVIDIKIPMRPYFMMDSGWRWMKNNLRAAQALDSLITENGDLFEYDVLITGVYNPKQYLSHLKNKSRFIFLNYVPDEELAFYYSKAFCFIYPSLAEGFGYSPLIAMKYKVPVICSSYTSVPEICGDAALYFNPTSIDDIRNRCLAVTDSKLRQELIRKGTIRLKNIEKRQHSDIQAQIKWIKD